MGKVRVPKLISTLFSPRRKDEKLCILQGQYFLNSCQLLAPTPPPTHTVGQNLHGVETEVVVVRPMVSPLKINK